MSTRRSFSFCFVLSVGLSLPALGQGAPPTAPGGAAGQPQREGPPGGDRPRGRRDGMMRGPGNMGELLQPEFTTRDLPLMVEGLELDEAQEAIVRTLIEDYASTFETGVAPVSQSIQEMGPALFRSFMSPESREKMRGAFEAAQQEVARQMEQLGELSSEQRQAIVEEQMTKAFEEVRAARAASGEAAESQRIMGEMVAAFDGWRSTRAAMRQKFIDDLRGQLSAQQEGRWASFERELDRVKSLPKGRLSGESTDLIGIVEDLDLSDEERAALKPTLEGYELRLAEALRSRNDYFAQSEPRLMRAIQELDSKEGLDIVRKQVQYRVRVRDVNEEFRTTIAAALPPESAKEFTAEALKASFDRIFRRSRMDEVLEHVRGLDLSPEVFAQVDAIELAYRQELDAMNEKLIALMKKEEPLEQVRQAERFAGFLTGDFRGGPGGFRGPGGGGEDDPVRQMLRERRDMGEKHVERIAAVIGPENAASIPEPERRSLGGGFDNLPEEVRSRILERADTNGNGRIDPEEQEAASRFFRDRARDGGGPGGGQGGPGGGGGRGPGGPPQ